ncbi:MAG: alpha/beta hydrolase [Herminiimonas sp.]|nr:alpha/beta hydrolase [Herminiimonas sp.]
MTASDAGLDPATRFAGDCAALANYCSTQYNARAGIPDHPQIFERWAQRSAQVRASTLGMLDLAFGEAAEERLDFFPAAKPGGALLVFIHGGWWRSLDKSDFSFIAPAFLAAGISVALTNYTLAPAATIEEIALQQVRAMVWIHRNAARLGADPDRIVVAGHSAGAHLAAMMMVADWPAYEADLPLDLVKAGIVFSGLYDLAPVQHAAFVNEDLRLTPERVGPLSPASMPQSHPTPFITAVGGLESDEFKRQNTLLARAWEASHVADIPLPASNHLTICDMLAEPGSALLEAALELVANNARATSARAS